MGSRVTLSIITPSQRARERERRREGERREERRWRWGDKTRGNPAEQKWLASVFID